MAYGLSEITQNGVDYRINDPNIANEFSASTAYSSGTYVNYNGILYRFTTDHPAGAWNASHVSAVEVGDEIADLKSAIETAADSIHEITGQQYGVFRSGYYPTRNDGVTVIDVSNPIPNSTFVCTYFAVSPGDTVKIKGKGATGLFRLYTFLDQNMKAIFRSDQSLEGEYNITIPDNVAFICINFHLPYDDYYAVLGVGLRDQIKEIDSNVKTSSLSWNHSIKNLDGSRYAIFQNGYIKNSENIVDYDVITPDDEFVCSVIEIEPDDKEVAFKGYGGAGDKKLWAILTETKTVITRSGDNVNGEFVIATPANAKYFVINSKKEYDFYARIGDGIVSREEVSFNNNIFEYKNLILGNVNSSTGLITSSTTSICTKNLIPLKAIESVHVDYPAPAFFYLYDIQGVFIANEGNVAKRQYVCSETRITELLNNYPNAYYVRIRIGNNTSPVTLDNMDSYNTKICLFKAEYEKAGLITIDNIQNKIVDGKLVESFSQIIPFNNEYKNQIITCVSKYECEAGVIDYPTIVLRSGKNLNRSSAYKMGEQGEYNINQWRFVRYPGDTNDYELEFSIPSGCTVYIKDIYNEYSNKNVKPSFGITIHGHRKMPMTPNDTLPAVLMAAKAGKKSFVEIPKRLSDGTWICYHDDSLVYNDTYIRQADGTSLPSTYNGTLWSDIDFNTANSWDWGISTNELYTGTKPMTLKRFFLTCAKTGINPVLSLHPFPTNEELQEIKIIAKKSGVLSALEIKTSSDNSIRRLYSVFGNNIDGYVLNIPAGAKTIEYIQNVISGINSLDGCTVKRGIELFASTAYDAYFGSSPYNAFEAISDAGLICSLAHQNGAYSPTKPGVNTNIMFGADFIWWAENHGVIEFTEDYNYSDGLNW